MSRAFCPHQPARLGQGGLRRDIRDVAEGQRIGAARILFFDPPCGLCWSVAEIAWVVHGCKESTRCSTLSDIGTFGSANGTTNRNWFKSVAKGSFGWTTGRHCNGRCKNSSSFSCTVRRGEDGEGLKLGFAFRFFHE